MYILTCESTVDLPSEELARFGIPYIPYPFTLDGESYRDDCGQTLSNAALYEAMKGGAMTGTAQINPYDYEAFFEPFLKEGKDVLHCVLSSGITNTMASAMIARETLEERYPGRRVLLLDTRAATGGEGLFVEMLAAKKAEGLSLDELFAWGEENRLRMHHWFFTSDLTYLIRGGRVSKAAGTIGNMLGICPLLHVDAAGKLTVREKHRPKSKVIRACAEKALAFADGGAEYSGPVWIFHSACRADAEAVAERVGQLLPKLKEPPRIGEIGATIGCHTGPGTVALFFLGTPRDLHE